MTTKTPRKYKQIAIVVKDIEKALKNWHEMLGIGAREVDCYPGAGAWPPKARLALLEYVGDMPVNSLAIQFASP